MTIDKPIFLYDINLFELNKNFVDRGKGDKYFEYHSKDFFGAVIRSAVALQYLDQQEVVMIVHPRFSHGSFRGVNIDLMTKDDPRVEEKEIDPAGLIHVDMNVVSNPGNIVINDTAALTSLFFHDHRGKESTIINFVTNGQSH